MNAIILAAGMGVRLRPLTDNRPKALVEVGGESFFERQVRLLRARGVHEITVVTGHAAEAFAPFHGRAGLTFVHNPHYHDRNNFYTMYLVRAALGDTIVLDGDVWLSEAVLDRVTADRSRWYVGHHDAARGEWFVETDAQGRVLEIQVRDGEGYVLSGISYWTAADGAALRAEMERWFSHRDTTNLYWDDLPRALLGQLWVGATPIAPDDWIEVDTLEDHARLEAALRSAAGSLR